jgi:O-antigen/teichoic acid export membrane protein
VSNPPANVSSDQQSPPGDGESRTGGSGLRAETLAEGFALLAILTVAQRVIGLLREILFCRWLAPDELGQWSLSFGFFLLAAPLVVCGLPGSFGRYVAYYRERGQLRPFLVRTTVVSGLLAAIGITLILLARRQVAWFIFDDPTRAHLVVLLALGLVSLVTFNYLVEFFAAMRLARVVYGIQVAASLLFAAIGLIALAAWQATAATLIVSYSLACLIAALGALYYFARVWRGEPPAATALPHTSLWSRIVPIAGWLWASNMLCNLFERADCYMIMHFGNMTQHVAETAVGNYHSSRVVPFLMVSVAGMLGGLILPHLSHHWERGRRDVVVGQLNLAYKLAAIAFLAGSVALLALSPLLFGWALGGKYNGGLAVLPWTLAGCLWFALVLIAVNYLWCAERVKLVSACFLSGLLLNVVLNWILLPRFGLLGAVLATAAGYGFALVLVHLFNRRHGMRVPAAVWLVSALPVLVGFGLWIGGLGLLAVIVLALRTNVLFTNDERFQVEEAIRGYIARGRGMAADLMIGYRNWRVPSSPTR